MNRKGTVWIVLFSAKLKLFHEKFEQTSGETSVV